MTTTTLSPCLVWPAAHDLDLLILNYLRAHGTTPLATLTAALAPPPPHDWCDWTNHEVDVDRALRRLWDSRKIAANVTEAGGKPTLSWRLTEAGEAAAASTPAGGCDREARCHSNTFWCARCGNVREVCDVRLHGEPCAHHPVPPPMAEIEARLQAAEQRRSEATREVDEASEQKRAREAYDRQRALIEGR